MKMVHSNSCLASMLCIIAIAASGAAAIATNPAAAPSIGAAAIATSSLSTLVAALKKCPKLLDAATSPSAHLTVLAPNNDAFAAAIQVLHVSQAQLLASPTLCDVLSLHIIAQEISPAHVTNGAVFPTLLKGASVKVIVMNDRISWEVVGEEMPAAVIEHVSASNGQVFVIDRVLLPPPAAPKKATAN